MVVDEHQRLMQTLGALEEATFATIRLFLESEPTAEPGVREHVERVALLSVNVASVCALREPNLSIIELAALLHHVPPFPSSDAGGPSREVVLTLDILRTIPAFAPSVNMITALPRAHEPNPADGHHTRLFVPFGARVIAICDRADQLMHREPYPLTGEQAAEVIQKDRVRGYHPETVDALCELLQGHRPAPSRERLPGVSRIRRSA